MWRPGIDKTTASERCLSGIVYFSSTRPGTPRRTTDVDDGDVCALYVRVYLLTRYAATHGGHRRKPRKRRHTATTVYTRARGDDDATTAAALLINARDRRQRRKRRAPVQHQQLRYHGERDATPVRTRDTPSTGREDSADGADAKYRQKKNNT